MRKRKHTPDMLWLESADRDGYYPFKIVASKADVLVTLGHWDQAEQLYQKNVDISGLFGNETRRALAQIDLGWMMTNRGQMDLSRRILTEAHAVLEREKNLKGLARCCNFLGTLHYRQGQYQKAIEYFQADLKLSASLNDQEGICALYGNLGIVYYEQGETDKALDHYRKQIELAERIGDTANVCNGMGNLASIHIDQGDYNQALECSRVQYDMATRMGEQNSIAIACNNIGDVCLRQGNILEARDNFEKQLAIAKKQGDKFLESVAYGDLGQVCQALGQHQEALQNYSQAKDLQAQQDIKYYLCYYLIFRAGLHYDLKQFSRAREDAASGKAIAAEIGREEMVFKARLLEALLTAEANLSEAETALTGLLAENQDGKRRFEILHQLYRITAKPAYKEQARELIKASDTATWPHSLRRLAGELE
ncbi:MAG: tetratricopeptide repeat protein [Deltaproteobacteria bacterium]|nr:tetratricopeptide repeat protein [Deltaproteobacteria bacterium]